MTTFSYLLVGLDDRFCANVLALGNPDSSGPHWPAGTATKRATRSDYVTNAQRRKHGFTKSSDVDNPRVAVQSLQGGPWATVVAIFAIAVVLEARKKGGTCRNQARANVAGIRADHDSEILMLDVPPPQLSRGLDAYMAIWEKFLSWSEKPIALDFSDVNIIAGKDVAFATAKGRCTGRGPNGKREELEFRLTMGFRKMDGSWRILNEHHSLPIA